jgi:hypothetical protein
MGFRKNITDAVALLQTFDAIFHHGLICHLHGYFVDEQDVHLVFRELDCCSMHGAIRLIESLHLNAKRIFTWSGPCLDSCYAKTFDGRHFIGRPSRWIWHEMAPEG